MANLILSNLTRTLSTYFRFGTVRLKDNTSVMQVRNAGDTAWLDVGVKQLRIQNTNATDAVVLSAPAGLGATVTYTFPGTDGSTGQVLSTNGSGTLSWVSVAAAADTTIIEVFDEGTSSPLTVLTPPANAVLRTVIIQVTIAAAGGNPTVALGVSGDEDLYVDEADSDLKEVGAYEVYPLADVGGSPVAVILTITPDSQTFDGKVFVTYSIP